MYAERFVYHAEVWKLITKLTLSDETDALGHIIADFCSMFNASYHYSYGDAQTLLYNGIDDIHSFLCKHYQ